MTLNKQFQSYALISKKNRKKLEINWQIPWKNRSRYQELEQFRNDEDIHHHTYHRHHQNARFYRSAFWGLGILFLSLMFIVMWHYPSWVSAFYEPHNILTKGVVSVVCAVLALSAFSIGCMIRVDKEAVSHLMGESKRRLLQTYTRRRMRLGLHRFFMFCEGYMHGTSLRYSYRNALNQLQDAKHTTLSLLQQIRSSKQLDHVSRVKLFNQALLELKERMDAVIDSFHEMKCV
jgi:hypothetical protein